MLRLFHQVIFSRRSSLFHHWSRDPVLGFSFLICWLILLTLLGMLRSFRFCKWSSFLPLYANYALSTKLFYFTVLFSYHIGLVWKISLSPIKHKFKFPVSSYVTDLRSFWIHALVLPLPIIAAISVWHPVLLLSIDLRFVNPLILPFNYYNNARCFIYSTLI